MSAYTNNNTNTQNELLMKNLMDFYGDKAHLCKMLSIINGESKISLRIVDWFVTNYAKMHYTVYELKFNKCNSTKEVETVRFKVYNDYKLKLKSYSKKKFDPFCRWDRISIPYNEEKYMETTIGQLNFFKWAIENKIIDYIENHYNAILADMNLRNSTSKRKQNVRAENDNTIATLENDGVSTGAGAGTGGGDNSKTRKKREELSVSACKCIKKETVKIIVKFN
jgi:hypothetical protein